jgi:hypothetical protein
MSSGGGPSGEQLRWLSQEGGLRVALVGHELVGGECILAPPLNGSGKARKEI